MAHSFIELDKAVVCMIHLFCFCDCGFHFVCPLWIRVRGLCKHPDGKDWLRGRLGLVLMEWTMLNKSLIQFFVHGWGCVPSLFFDLRPNYGGGNEDNGNLFKRPCACTASLSAFDPAAGHHWPVPLPETPWHSWASQVSLMWGQLLLSLRSLCSLGFVCALQESVSPVLCKFWWLCGGVNGNLFQEGLCHPQVCCSRNPCPYGRPLLTRMSPQDTQTLSGRSGTVSVGSPDVHSVLFEPSKCLWDLMFDSKCNFSPPTVLLGLLWPWTWVIFFFVCVCGIQHFPVDSCSAASYNLKFSQKKMSPHPSTLPSWGTSSI